jgi:hypothetical protein
MDTLSRRQWLAVTAAAFCPFSTAQDNTAAPVDGRLGPPKTLNDAFPFTPPKSLGDWQIRRTRLREQLLVALGLWPLPQKLPGDVWYHGTIARDGYTIERVAFQADHRHIVTGNLYRPAGIKPGQKLPAVLFAHGHWTDGRLHVESDAIAKTLVDTQAEPDLQTAKYFMQHLPALLAANGMICFAFDMVGYADSTAIGHVAKSGVPHPNGFATVDCELHLHSLMGLQILNCIRCIDFLAKLPEVDPTRIGMTGASGGGTQTFLTAALDDRIAVAAPAVMVSTAMQGGCVCENCSILRVGTGNVEIAACIAPRPLALTAANDWTKDIITKGYPELQHVYDLFKKKENVIAKAWPEYPHNYNMPARTFVAEWFVKHFLPGQMLRPVEFQPVPVRELTVFVASHPMPAQPDAAQWRAEKQLQDFTDLNHLLPVLDTPREPFVATYRAAVRAMVADDVPGKVAIRKGPLASTVDGCSVHRAWLGRETETDALPSAGLFSKAFTGEKVLLWFHPDGKETLFEDGKIAAAARTAIDAGYAVVSADLLGSGALAFEKPRPVNPVYAGFTWGYNRTLLAERVHDILTIVGFTKTILKAKTIHMVGWQAAGPGVALARVLAQDAVSRTAVDMNQFDFKNINDFNDPMMLPGALKYDLSTTMMTAVWDRPLLAYNVARPGRALVKDAAVEIDSKPRDASAVMKWLIG